MDRCKLAYSGKSWLRLRGSPAAIMAGRDSVRIALHRLHVVSAPPARLTRRPCWHRGTRAVWGQREMLDGRPCWAARADRFKRVFGAVSAGVVTVGFDAVGEVVRAVSLGRDGGVDGAQRFTAATAAGHVSVSAVVFGSFYCLPDALGEVAQVGGGCH